MLEVRALTKRYSGSPAVDQVSFTALPGEVTGYLGPNGSGKSTTVKMITGLLDPTGAKSFIAGGPSATTWSNSSAFSDTCPRSRTSTPT